MVAQEIEESFLSPKHAEENILKFLDYAEEFNGALNDALGLTNGTRDGKRLRQFIVDNQLNVNKMHVALGFHEGKGPSVEEIADEFAHYVTNLNASRLEDVRYGITYFGGTADGTNYRNLPSASSFVSQDPSYTAKAVNFINEQLVESGHERISNTYTERIDPASLYDRNELLEARGDKFIPMDDKKFMDKLVSRRMGIGAIIAGAGIMAAGYVGGNPVQPASTQAMLEQQSTGNHMPRQYTPEMYNESYGTNAGYVINIKAQSAIERDRMVQAVNQVISDMSSTNVNMNINSSYRNLNSRELENEITRAF